MKRVAVLAAWMTAWGLLCAQQSLAETAYRQYHGKWKEEPSRTVADIEQFLPAPAVKLSKYGGWSEITVEATGFFRTAKIGGRWWLIDPEGHPFLSVGLCTVAPDNIHPGPLSETFGDRGQWAEQTGAFLKAHGFNTVGSWSAWRLVRQTEQRIPYTRNWSFMAAYKNKRPKRNGARGCPQRCMPIFDPEFEQFCDRYAQQLAETKDDPWLLGHFSDNELPFRPNALENYLSLPQSDLGYQAAKKWWDRRSKGDPNRKITQQDHYDFVQQIAVRYYTTVTAAMRKYDPNHLIIGSRVHGRTIIEPVFRGSASVDVVSVNYYHRWGPEPQRMQKWLEWSGKPFISSEWYAMTIPSPKQYIRGAGFKVKRQRDQGLYYQNYTLGLLKSPSCVGWHWYKYTDDHRPRPLGIISRDAQPRETLLGMMKEVNRQAYPLASWFNGTPLRQTAERRNPADADQLLR